MPIIPLAGTSAAKGALVPIASNKILVNTQIITFANIPQIYQDLMLVISGASTFAAVSGGFAMQFNGDTGTNYSHTWLQGNGSTVTSGRANNQTITSEGGVPGTAVAPTIFGPVITHILNYRNTTTFKTVISQAGNEYNQAGTSRISVNLWRNTAAITSMNCYTSADWTAGSTFMLYGIRTVNQ